ncbi:MAG: MaoC family dehydratase N-terminal domain-containing protein [Actinomycetales bacterium]
MPVNDAFSGRTYPPTAVYEVGREHIRSFAEALAAGGPVHPAHVDATAAQALGYPDVIAPPTMAVIVAHAANEQYTSDPESGIDYSRVVHGEQKFTHHRPIVAGDRLVTTLTVDSIRGAGGHAMITMRSEIAAESGEPVCTAIGTIVVRGGD